MLNFCCKLAVLYHGTAMVIAPPFEKGFWEESEYEKKSETAFRDGHDVGGAVW